jgi:hypothetical protein
MTRSLPILAATSLLAATLALAATAAAQGDKKAAGPPPPPVWHAQAMATSEIGGSSFTHFWSKGRSLRALTVVQGRPVLTLVHRDWYYAIDELGQEGIAVQRSPQARADDAKGERPFGEEAKVMLARGEKIRSEKRGPTTVDIYRLNDESARRDVWVAQGPEHLPLRVEIFDKALKSQHRRDYFGWTQELEIPDAFFEPDPRVKLERYSYDEYLKKSANDPVGPVPVMYGSLLHGEPGEGAPAPATGAPSPR